MGLVSFEKIGVKNRIQFPSKKEKIKKNTKNGRKKREIPREPQKSRKRLGVGGVLVSVLVPTLNNHLPT